MSSRSNTSTSTHKTSRYPSTVGAAITTLGLPEAKLEEAAAPTAAEATPVTEAAVISVEVSVIVSEIEVRVIVSSTFCGEVAA